MSFDPVGAPAPTAWRPISTTRTGSAPRGGLAPVDPRTLSHARAFIEAHAAESIHADDIARAAAVTVRSVQLAFRRHLDTTPGSYLRAVRLERAHQDLVQASRGRGGTVASIAARWGFTSPSRFAAYYRQKFGVLPSETLQR